MSNQQKRITGMFARYLALILLGAGNFYIIYAILTPLTIRITATILSIFTASTVVNNLIRITDSVIQIVPACVAGAAFYLLLILNLSVPNIKPATRIKVILTSIAILFALNITRILFLILIIKSTYFQTIHWGIWHLISTIFVVGTWLIVVKIYEIKSIPIYSDAKYLIDSIKNPKRKK